MRASGAKYYTRKSFEPLEKWWIHKALDVCMSSTGVNEKKLHGSNFVCEELLNRNKILRLLVTVHEKWITFGNAKRKRHWSKSSSRYKWCPSQDWRSGRYCCAIDGIGKESYIMICSSIPVLSVIGPSEGSKRPEQRQITHQKIRELSWEARASILLTVRTSHYKNYI